MKLANIFIILTIFGTAAAFSLSMSSQQQQQSSSSSKIDRRSFVRTAAVGAAGGIMAQAGLLNNVQPAVADDDDGFVTTESGMKYKVLKEGTGGIPTPGQTVKVSIPVVDVMTRYLHSDHLT